MFGQTETKLEDARLALEGMKSATDPLSFRSQFSAFLQHARAITYALQKDGRHIPGFEEWYNGKQQEMGGDELLKFICDARDEDVHEGKHRLDFGTHIQHLSLDAAGPPPSPGAALVMGREGPLWIVDRGTPQERRIPIKKGGVWTTWVSMKGAPTVHLGKSLERNDPLTVAQLALDYYASVLSNLNLRIEAS